MESSIKLQKNVEICVKLRKLQKLKKFWNWALNCGKLRIAIPWVGNVSNNSGATTHRFPWAAESEEDGERKQVTQSNSVCKMHCLCTVERGETLQCCLIFFFFGHSHPVKEKKIIQFETHLQF